MHRHRHRSFGQQPRFSIIDDGIRFAFAGLLFAFYCWLRRGH